MTINSIIISQYRASLKMLEQVIINCSDTLWADEDYGNKFWQIAFHAIFYTHLYLAPSEEDFIPWGKHRDGYQYMGTFPWPPFDKPEIGEAYNKEDILEYLGVCEVEVAEKISRVDLGAESGFSWIPMNKLELQFYNIRHLQQHIGELCERLWDREQVEIDWVGMRPTQS